MINRRRFLTQSIALAAATATSYNEAAAAEKPHVRTVLGPVDPSQLGATLMHEHAPLVDWSELYETPAADIEPIRSRLLEDNARALRAFHETLPDEQRPGAMVEGTPIRVGRYPRLLVELARRVPLHIIASTGFWGEALAPQHPWAIRLGVEEDGVRKMAELYIREIRTGMEDPQGGWGERFTDVKAGMIKVATSTHLRPSERRCHEAAAIAGRETGSPITTHTTDGGGLEQARLLVRLGVQPEKIIIGHQGHLDDRQNPEAPDYHRTIADMGCNVQFDRLGETNYPVEKAARLIRTLVSAGHLERVLVAHDIVPFFYTRYFQQSKPADGWQARKSDFTLIPTQLVPALKQEGLTDQQVRMILVENPQRVLAF